MTASNSILEYYRKVSERFYLAREYGPVGKIYIKYLWQPMATAVVIPGYEGFDMFIYKENKSLNLCDALTGAVIVRKDGLQARAQRRMNKKTFIMALPAILKNQGGAAEINVLIINYLCDHNQLISPRYEAKEV